MNAAHFMYSVLTCFGISLIGSGVRAQEASPPPVFDKETNTLTYPAPKFVRRTAPANPISKLDALRHWDGTGELLLEPAPEDSPTSVSEVGATFDNTDGGGPDAELSERVDGRCPAGVMWYQLRGGRLALSQPASSHDNQSPRASSTRDQPGLVFSANHCRYRITLQTKMLDKGQWVVAPEAANPEYKPILPSGPVVHLPPNTKVVMEVGPLPQELISSRQTWATGARLTPEMIGACPVITGMTDFEPKGVFFSQVSPTHHEFTVGVRREPDLKTTALIFQNNRCREEVHVTREISHNEVWIPSSLSANPPSADTGTDSPAR